MQSVTSIKQAKKLVLTSKAVFIDVRFGSSEQQVKRTKKEALYFLNRFDENANPEELGMYTGSFGSYCDERNILYLGKKEIVMKDSIRYRTVVVTPTEVIYGESMVGTKETYEKNVETCKYIVNDAKYVNILSSNGREYVFPGAFFENHCYVYLEKLDT